MKIHQMDVQGALASLRSSPQGLTAEEAARRFAEYGPNRVEQAAKQSLWSCVARDFFHCFALILWVSAGLAFVAEWFEPGQGTGRVGVAVIIVILVSGVFSFWQERRVERTLAALLALLPDRVEVRRDDAVAVLEADRLVPGDVVLLEQGAKIPADCRIIEAWDVRVNNATVTGESAPKARDAEPSSEELTLHGRNVLLAGASLVSGRCTAVVFATGMATEFGRIAHLTQTGAQAVSPLRRELTRLSRLIAALAVGIGLTFFAVGAVIGVPFWKDFIFSIGIIVAMVPEGLLPTLTLALVLTARRMAGRNVLIRRLPSVETLGSTSVICTDKTGTLTENRMWVRELLLDGALLAPKDLASEAWPARDALLAAGLCHSLKPTGPTGPGGAREYLGDPMERALVELADSVAPGPPAWRRLDELPFDATRMRHSVLYETPAGPTLYVKGAPESVLPLCVGMPGPGGASPLDTAALEKARAAQEAMTARGLRVLAFACREVRLPCPREELERGLTFLGLAGLEDPPRPEAKEAVRRCREAGIKVVMVTGDHPRTALAVAREIGLVRSEHPRMLTGDELRRLSDTQLQLALDAPEIVFARLAAAQKLRIVEALKKKRHIVAVTGDGVNDAPALKAAHIGVAMGVSGADVAREAADMVLLDDNFASIVSGIEEGRAIFENIRKFLTYVLVHNVAQLVPYLAFAMFRIPLPITPLQVLSVDMGTDTLTALGLGVERPAPDVMRDPPRSRNRRLLDLSLALRAYFFLGLIEASAALGAFFFVLLRSGWRYGQALASDDPTYLAATTACLAAIVVLQIVNVYLCRDPRRSAFASGLADNRLIAAGVALETAIIAFIAYTPMGNALLGAAPLDAGVWLFLLPFAVGMLVLEEARKAVVRRLARRRTTA